MHNETSSNSIGVLNETMVNNIVVTILKIRVKRNVFTRQKNRQEAEYNNVKRYVYGEYTERILCFYLIDARDATKSFINFKHRK